MCLPFPLCLDVYKRQQEDCTCRRHHRYYERSVSPFYYEGPAKAAILTLKEERDPHIVEVLAKEMADVVAREYGDIAFDAVVPVPMTAAEMREKMCIRDRWYSPVWRKRKKHEQI